MWYVRIVYLIGAFGLCLEVLQLPSLIIAVLLHEHMAASAFLISQFLGLFLSGCLFLGFRAKAVEPKRASGIVLPVAAFLYGACLAGMPFFFFDMAGGPVRAFAQGMALLSTSGGDYYQYLDAVPTSFQVWRGMSAWMGGFAAIIMVLAIYTQLNHGGVQLHRSSLAFGAARPGMSRLRSLSYALFPLYCAVTALLVIGLCASGIDLPKALLFAAGAISSTGLSIGGGFPDVSSGTLFVLSTAMLLTLANWDYLLTLLVGAKKSGSFDPEFLVVVIVLVSAALAYMLLVDGGVSRPYSTFFLVTSALSGTGWVPAGYGAEAGNLYAGLGLLALASLGGAAASTTGGLKGIRLLVLLQLARGELERLAYPHRVATVEVLGQRLRYSDIDAIWLLVASSVLAAITGTLLYAIVSWSIVDALHLAITALTLSAPLMDFLSPGFAGLHSFGDFELLLTAILNLIGRIEASVFLALFVWQLWRG